MKVQILSQKKTHFCQKIKVSEIFYEEKKEPSLINIITETDELFGQMPIIFGSEENMKTIKVER